MSGFKFFKRRLNCSLMEIRVSKVADYPFKTLQVRGVLTEMNDFLRSVSFCASKMRLCES
jgi:hypothetical protein